MRAISVATKFVTVAQASGPSSKATYKYTPSRAKPTGECIQDLATRTQACAQIKMFGSLASPHLGSRSSSSSYSTRLSTLVPLLVRLVSIRRDSRKVSTTTRTRDHRRDAAEVALNSKLCVEKYVFRSRCPFYAPIWLAFSMKNIHSSSTTWFHLNMPFTVFFIGGGIPHYLNALKVKRFAQFPWNNFIPFGLSESHPLLRGTDSKSIRLLQQHILPRPRVGSRMYSLPTAKIYTRWSI